MEARLNPYPFGIPQHYSCFTSPASVPSLGFFLAQLSPVYAHFLEVNNCSWALPDLRSNGLPTAVLTERVEVEAVAKKASSARICLVPGKKRGRKPLRPQDPIRKKTEQKDKYWFRTFRSYMRENYTLLSPAMSHEAQSFWKAYLSLAGRPSKGGQFPSYSKEYKNYLFGHVTFDEYFTQWFRCSGEVVLCQKYPRNSALWFVYYDYAASELVNYKLLHNL